MYVLNNFLVEIVERNEAGEVEVKFVSRVNGGKGRLPKNKKVKSEDLTELVSFEDFMNEVR